MRCEMPRVVKARVYMLNLPTLDPHYHLVKSLSIVLRADIVVSYYKLLGRNSESCAAALPKEPLVIHWRELRCAEIIR